MLGNESAMHRVLIVEDEVPLRRIIMRNLAVRGYTVVEADSVASAIEALETFATPFDLILLDINLPDQSGWDVLRYLKARSAKLEHTGATRSPMPRVIVLTAVHPARCRMEEFQPAAMLLKPFPIDALLRLVSRVLAGAARHVENEVDVPSQAPFLPTQNSAPG